MRTRVTNVRGDLEQRNEEEQDKEKQDLGYKDQGEDLEVQEDVEQGDHDPVEKDLKEQKWDQDQKVHEGQTQRNPKQG